MYKANYFTIANDESPDKLKLEELLNRAHVENTCRIISVDKSFTQAGPVIVFVVYVELGPKGRPPAVPLSSPGRHVELSEEEYPSFDLDKVVP